MKHNLLEKVDELFKESDNLSVDKLESFVHDTLIFFEELRGILATGTEEEKKEALEFSMKLQHKFQQLAEKTYDKMGMTEEQVKHFLKQSNFPEKEWNTIQKIDGEMSDYQKNVLGETPKSQAKRHKFPTWREKI